MANSTSKAFGADEQVLDCIITDLMEMGFRGKLTQIRASLGSSFQDLNALEMVNHALDCAARLGFSDVEI